MITQLAPPNFDGVGFKGAFGMQSFGDGFTAVCHGDANEASVYYAKNASLPPHTITLTPSDTSAPSSVAAAVYLKNALYFTNAFQEEIYKVPILDFSEYSVDGAIRFGPAETIKLSTPEGFGYKSEVSNARAIEIAPDQKHLLVLSEASGAIFRVDPATGEVLKVDVSGALLFRPNDMTACAFYYKSKRLFVTNTYLDSVLVFDLDDDALSATLVAEFKGKLSTPVSMVMYTSFAIAANLAASGEPSFLSFMDMGEAGFGCDGCPPGCKPAPTSRRSRSRRLLFGSFSLARCGKDCVAA